MILIKLVLNFDELFRKRNFFKRYVEEECGRKFNVEGCFRNIEKQYKNFDESSRDEKFSELHKEKTWLFFKLVVKRNLEVIESNQKHTQKNENYDIFGSYPISITIFKYEYGYGNSMLKELVMIFYKLFNLFKRCVEEEYESKSNVEAYFGNTEKQYRKLDEFFRDKKFLELHEEERRLLFKLVVKRSLEVIESNQKHKRPIKNFNISEKKNSISLVCSVNEGVRFLKTPKKDIEKLLFEIITKEKLNLDSTTQLEMCAKVKENKILISEAKNVFSQLIQNNIEIEKMIEHPLFWTDNDKIQLIIYCGDTLDCKKSEWEKYKKIYEVCLKSIGTVCFAQTTLATVIKALFFKMVQCLVVVKM